MRILRLWNETGTMIWRFLLFTYIIFYWNLVAITETLVCITEISNICGAPITITVSAMDVCWQGNELHFIFRYIISLKWSFSSSSIRGIMFECAPVSKTDRYFSCSWISSREMMKTHAMKFVRIQIDFSGVFRESAEVFVFRRDA